MSSKFVLALALGLLLPLQFAHAERFKVGSIAATSGPVAELAQAIVDARELAANHINANGGVLDGRLVDLVSADSGCDPQIARGAAAQLVYDSDWTDTDNREVLATLSGVANIDGITAGSFDIA